MTLRLIARSPALWIPALLVLGACGEDPRDDPPAGDPVTAGDPPAAVEPGKDPVAVARPSDELARRFADADPTEWVTVLDPERATPGYTLELYRRRLPFLFDLAGRVVHAWPSVRAVGRARLTRDCQLYAITPDHAIEAYDWNGRRRFRYTLPEGHFPHHDVIRLRNGNFLVLAHAEIGKDAEPGARRSIRDYVVEVDPSGGEPSGREAREVWTWSARDHRDRFVPAWNDRVVDPTHVNSLHEIGPNPLFEAGDARFRPGNLLLSARHLNTVLIVDRETGEVVWLYRDGLDFQHEASLIPSGWPGAGQILLFNNGYKGTLGHRRSRVESFDPVTRERGFEFTSRFFHSRVAGTVQALPSGHFVVASSHGGRIFELTRDGEIVWQIETPFEPMRPERYAPDHCPRLASLQPGPLPAKSRDAPFFDRDVYAFLLAGDGDERPRLAGFEQPRLQDARGCRRLRLPPGARAVFEYGLDAGRLDGAPLEARFTAELREMGGDRREHLVDTTVRWGPGLGPQRRTVGLDAWAGRSVELCLDARIAGDAPGDDPRQALVWSVPDIAVGEPEAAAPVALTAEEEKLREEQLRRIGYAQ